MRLMNPSPGEVIDRITILALKVQHSDRSEFREEKESLHDYLSSKDWIISNDLHKELATINSRLWDLEDAQRAILKGNKWEENLVALLNDTDTEDIVIDFARNAKTIIELNDARAETVRKINVACGIDSLEKLHDINKNG